MQHTTNNPTETTIQHTNNDSTEPPSPLAVQPTGQPHTHLTPPTASTQHPHRPQPAKRHYSDIEPDLDFSHPSFNFPPIKRHHDMRYPPTPQYQPNTYEPAPTEQGAADQSIDDDDQEEYDTNTALQFPGIRTLHDEGQPIMYRTMQRYWDHEAHLFQGFNADDIVDIERHFADANILNYRREIEDICQERYGLTFRGGLMEHGQQLLGDPLQRTVQAWAAPRRGYLFLRDISMVMVYQYAGVLDNGLSFHQLEYRNPSKISPGDLMCALRALGATDAIVQSYPDV
ncbi:hypothetical protein AaE_014396 [Aphanomyces astaci]|uniref:Uncharacterized protein n=1 Tax=Aphanomyces astaci TaxID=112090 RepID=A0A6A4ZE85_APHAT|nr:hypothetical protein AaE_014396 [Aphanomyces astaci]